jgi:GNAT superfamily N-acetyltransferase
MNAAPFRIAALDGQKHERDNFCSASESLNRYLREQSTQDVRRRVAACFVALTDEDRIAGFYTLAATGVLLADLPAGTQKKLPRYPTVPAILLGRLAVDQAFAGQGLGSALLADAIHRATYSDIAAFALVASAKDEHASGFYRHHGFIAFPNSPLTLFLPLSKVST